MTQGMLQDRRSQQQRQAIICLDGSQGIHITLAHHVSRRGAHFLWEWVQGAASIHFCNTSSLLSLLVCVQASGGDRDAWYIRIFAGPELTGCLIARLPTVTGGGIGKASVTVHIMALEPVK